ncbi:hypothetical protein [Albibacterium indicum]|uniref:hypothetical protein n=1 Tax=Albibacterium indicum TaxID=2292082 RepID=UPI000E4D14DA|nr:hypothetical protein [Pedobacter indicus]
MYRKFVLEKLKGSIERELGIVAFILVNNPVIIKSVPADLSTSDTEILVLTSLKVQAFSKFLFTSDFGCLVSPSL